MIPDTVIWTPRRGTKTGKSCRNLIMEEVSWS